MQTKNQNKVTENKPRLKNIPYTQPVNFASLVDYQEGQVVSRTLTQGTNLGLTLFAFDQGEQISSHASTGDALVLILDGRARITIGQDDFEVSKGEAIVMPANIPHALWAMERFKMMLTVVFQN